MSVHVTSWAWKQQVGDADAKLVLLKLADQANDDGVAWPSRKTIAAECELGKGEPGLHCVKRKIRALKEADLVVPVPRYDGTGRQTSNSYHLPYSAHAREVLADAITNAGEGATTDPLPGPPQAPSGGPPQAPSKKNPSEGTVENPDGFSNVVDRWLLFAPPLVAHKREALMADKPTRKLVEKALATHGLEDVVAAIINYAEVLGSDAYWLSQRWTMHLFFKQRNAFPMFLMEASPLANYRNRKSNGARDKGLSFDEILTGGGNEPGIESRPAITAGV